MEGSSDMPAAQSADPELQAVAFAIRNDDPTGTRTARVLRQTMDQLYDGQRTGRYRLDQLYKTEKTHCGTLVEINLQREFEFEDGLILDFRINGVEVDCKYSQTVGGWMIPPEAVGRLCILISAEDNANPFWSLGLVRVNANLLGAPNRDGKRKLSDSGRRAIMWLWQQEPLPPNVLLQLDRDVVDRIMSFRHGTKRTNELFRRAMGRIVGRGVVATVAKQDDYMKRLRENGGARTALRPEGIIILGQYQTHASIAAALNIPRPGPGESISIRVAPAQNAGPGVAAIGGGLWRVATEDDPVVRAPVLPKT